MIIPYNVLFKRNPDIKGRGDASSDDGSSDGGNLSPQNQAIIGAVVGGVALIAITAGILVFLIKKQKWDRIRKREEALLALHAPPPYGSDSQLRSGSRSLWSRSTPPRKSISPPLVAPRPVTLPPAMREVEEQPPAYGAHSSFPIPIYDPSRYPFQHQYQQFRPASALTVNNGCLHYVAGDMVHGHRSSLPGSRLSLPFGVGVDQRNAIQGRRPVQERPQAQSQAQSQVPGGSREILQPDLGSNVNMNASSITSENAGTTRPPRKPKPVLSRIITNFG